MNPYDIDISKLKDSLDIADIEDEKLIIKLKLTEFFLKATYEMPSSEIISLTKLDKADLSRLRAFNVDRFSIDKLIGLLINLGFSANIDIKPIAI